MEFSSEVWLAKGKPWLPFAGDRKLFRKPQASYILDNSNITKSMLTLRGVFMAYNFSLKSYANGTYQLTYYDTPMLDSDDLKKLKYKKNDKLSDGTSRVNDFNYLDDDSDYYTPWGYEELSELEEGVETDDDDSVFEADAGIIEYNRERSINVSLNRSVRQIYDYGRNNVWTWFFTFTFSNDCGVNRFDYDDCSKKVRQWLNNIKKRKCKNMSYLLVPEKHPSSGAWHFHALVNNVEELTFVKAVNQQEFLKDDAGNIIYNKKGQPVPNKYFGKHLRTSYPDGDYIYNVKEYNNGWSTATKVQDTRKAVSYIVKYITKDLCECTFGKRRYYPSRNLTLPARNLGFFEKESLSELISFIEYTYGVKMSMDVIKTVNIKVNGYENKVSYLEFN